MDYSATPIIVFSHLRWNFVFQRPQHIMQRLSKRRQILFIEEPLHHTNDATNETKREKISDTITVIQPALQKKATEEMVGLTREFMQQKGFVDPIVWLYSAAFIDVAKQIDCSLLVYDCMDELSAFKGAAKELKYQERELLSLADIIFTGGKSLYEAKKDAAEQVYCFPSAVDVKHFSSVQKRYTDLPFDIRDIPRPIVGFYGVLDERLDTELLDVIATKLPDVSFVLIGPVVKIDPSVLPKHPNIYYLGSKTYKELPVYLSAMDVTMLPFAMNESTRYISPTKTLEYMAAKKPIISTPIYDVVNTFGKEVRIAKDANMFVQAITDYLHESSEDKKIRETLQEKRIEQNSWDRTVAEMEKNILEQLRHVTSSPQQNAIIL